MGFTQKQVQSLRRPLSQHVVRTRTLNGRELSYIEGWHAIAEANRIFGFDKWDRETVEARCIVGRENRGQYLAVYSAKVRITVRAGDEIVIREGQGTGECKTGSPGEVHDTALKSAETDATKRALATFGYPFGLSLYVTPKAAARSRRGLEQGSAPTHASLGPDDLTSTAPVAAQSDADAHRKTASNLTRLHGPAGAAQTQLIHFSGTVPPVEPARDDDTAPNNALAVERAPQEGASDTSIDKSRLVFGEPRRRRNKAHLRFVASQPCLLCGRLPADAHHLKFMQPRALGLKVSDEFTVPLCRIHHRQLHQSGNEVSWWNDLEIDAEAIAQGLWEQSHRLDRSLSPVEDMLSTQRQARHRR